MKTITFLFLASLLFVAQSSQESPELKEAATLTESVVTLFNERKFDEALPLAKRALEIREMTTSKWRALWLDSKRFIAIGKTWIKLLQFTIVHFQFMGSAEV